MWLFFAVSQERDEYIHYLYIFISYLLLHKTCYLKVHSLKQQTLVFSYSFCEPEIQEQLRWVILA